MKRGFLWLLKNTLNRLTLRLARRGLGPFWIIRHVGRKSGRSFETPLILAPVPEGFVAELTYGPGVNWYRNIVAASGGTVVRGGREWHVTAIEPLGAEEGLAAFGPPAAFVLRLLRKREFRLLRASGPHD
jgi:deazaflavin-dependent oxidoreductase (nitroreductase family)